MTRMGKQRGKTKKGCAAQKVRNTLQGIFQQWWDEFMGGWRVIKKQGVPNEYVAYPYKDATNLREIAFEPLPRKALPNPYVMIYTVKVI